MKMARLEIFLFGGFHVRYAGETVTHFESDKVRALLAYLLLFPGQPHRREWLAGLLWSDRSELSARTNLRIALSSLRNAIHEQTESPHFIQADRQTILWKQSSDYWLDVEAFAQRIAGFETAASPADQVSAALNLYTGDFLRGFSLADCNEFEDWITRERDKWREQALLACLRVAETLEAEDAPQAAIGYLRRGLEITPWHEDSYYRLMALYARTGQRSLALVQYRQCRDALRAELGVEPSQKTQALYEKVASAPHRERADRRERSHTQHLPAVMSGFVGRAAEITRLSRLLEQPQHRLVTILAPGGMGKTHLAVALAHHQQGAFSDGVFFISLQAMTDPRALSSVIAHSLDCPLGDSDSDVEKHLSEFLQPKQLLLVLDNFEHLLSAAALLMLLLRAAPNLKMLVTSRERLKLSSETVFMLDGLAHADSTPVQNEAAQFLIQSIRRVHPGFVSSEKDYPAIQAVCELTGGMPLALLLAASWATIRSLPEIASALERDMMTTSADFRDLPPRHQNLQAVFDQTWGFMHQVEQEAMMKLSVFQGGFTTEAASALAVRDPQTFVLLTDKSLIRRTRVFRVGQSMRWCASMLSNNSKKRIGNTRREMPMRPLSPVSCTTA